MKRKLAAAAAVIVISAAGALAWFRIPVDMPVVGELFGPAIEIADEATLRSDLTVPDGFSFSVYATGLGKARLMQATPGGGLYVSTPNVDEVKYLQPDGDNDGRSDATTVVAKRLNQPHGLWLDGETLYVAEKHQVTAFDAEVKSGKLSGRRVVVEGLPPGSGHRTRTLKRGPDGWFYVSAGSSCNVCMEENPRRAAIMRFKPEGELEIFATGLRNTVGFDWQPGTGALYGVENSRDWLGDDFPPDELNLIEKDGFYGWPFFNGDNVKDPDLGSAEEARALKPVKPAYAFNAHVAPLAITFLKHQPQAGLNGSALVSQHGSWNRSKKTGYRVVRLVWGEDGKITLKPFLEGFLQGDKTMGRPVDVLETADGTIFISDDRNGAIYRLKPTTG